MKTLKSTLVMGIVALMIGAPGQLLAKKKVNLKYNLHKNDTYVTKSNINQDIQMQAQGRTVDIQAQTGIDVTTAVSELASNSIELKTTINKMTLTQSVMGRKIHFDSSDPSTYASGSGKLIGDKLNQLIGKSYTKVMDDLGNVKSMDLSHLQEGLKTTGKLSSRDIYVVFPGHAVEVGDSWEATISPKQNSNMVIHVKYTLNKLSGKEAVIGIDAKISGSKVAGVDMSLSGVVNGEATVDVKTGWTTKVNVDQEVKMNAQTNGMTIPMTISGNITVTSVKK